MFYSVKARYIPSKLAELRQKLSDGSIASQKPDGQEIVSSMHRARITEPGIVQWSEMCFCSTPLQHERETVLDHFFSEMEINQSNGYIEFDGASFMDFLANKDS